MHVNSCRSVLIVGSLCVRGEKLWNNGKQNCFKTRVFERKKYCIAHVIDH